jgi:hypothetical protein
MPDSLEVKRCLHAADRRTCIPCARLALSVQTERDTPIFDRSGGRLLNKTLTDVRESVSKSRKVGGK